MILIADSGGTSTSWRLVDTDGQIAQASTLGFNPYAHPSSRLEHILHDELLPSGQIDPSSVRALYFYGAGCSAEDVVASVGQTVSGVFKNAQVEVHSDLLAAARALCGNQPGIACILGTGTNTCHFDGEEIVENIPSMGYALADEGSGAYLGKQLLNDYFRKGMPDIVAQRLKKRFGLERDAVLREVYHGEGPSQYLASFSKFIFQNIKEAYCYQLVYDAFDTFLEKNVMRYEAHKELPVHFTGSVAFYYSNILRQVAQDRGISIKTIAESPIAGLTLYHSRQ